MLFRRVRRPALAVLTLIVSLWGAPGAGPAAARGTAPAAGQPGPGDWPMYLNTPDRQAWNAGETALSPATAPALRLKWQADLGSILAAPPAVVGDTVYAGSWDGYEYALNTADGSRRWRTFLGTSGYPGYCKPSAAGITSGAAVSNGLVYVGGGATDFYALDAATGQPAWNLFTGDSSPEGGHYNWASPLVVGNRVYSGIASFCDRPFVRGYAWSADAATGQDEQRFYTVNENALGGGIWTSPTVDVAHNRMFLTTGSPGDAEGYPDCILVFDLTTHQLLAAWRVPREQEVKDPDWGTTPTLFTLPDGRQMVAAGNKNGIMYVFAADHVGSGPLWQYQVSDGGECPQCGEGVISSAVYHDGVLYQGGGHTRIGGKDVQGSMRAFDAASGKLLWEQPTLGTVVPAAAGANGVIVLADDNELRVLEAATGRLLFIFGIHETIWAAPVIAHGMVYMAGTDGTLYAFEVPPELVPPTAPPAPSPSPTVAAPRPAALAPVPAPPPGPALYFAATGHTLAPPLRAYWESYGGLAQFGYPLTEPFTETVTTGVDGPSRDYLVQYFERARFEYHPEYSGTPSAVLLGLLGVHFHAPEPPVPALGTPGTTYLNGHNLGGPFRRYWEAHGGLFVNGYPIGEEHDEVSPTDGHTYRVQYFERARMEFHPEYAGTDHEVLLGLLGTQLLRERGWVR